MANTNKNNSLKIPRGYAKRECERPYFTKKEYYEIVETLVKVLKPGNASASGVTAFTEDQVELVLKVFISTFAKDNKKFDPMFFRKYFYKMLEEEN